MADGSVAVASWLQRLAPDVVATVRRFPLAIVFAAGATIAFLVGANFNQWLDPEGWIRVFVGLATGAICAVAGVYFVESRPQARVMGLLLLYGLPIAIAAACQLRDTALIVPFTLPLAAILWLSVSPVTRVGQGAVREEQQHRFWWINHRAIATAALAGLAFCVIAIGFMAIERSLSLLFGISSSDIFYRWLLPFTGLFLTPVYWLSTLPRLDEYEPAEMERPDFIAGSVGFLGQFVLAPLLVLYAAILLVYSAQIVLTQQLPEGMIGWMVLGFVIAGAGTWLVLHPPFMRRKPLVRLFQRWWWWLTPIPLALFFIAAWVRVDAYGLTPERLMILTGGVWATLLTLVFLFRRGDIRLIPAVAGAILAIFSIGPWSYFAWPDADQGSRLNSLLAMKADPTATVSSPSWTPEQQSAATSAMFFLDSTPHGRQTLRRVLLDHGFVHDPAAESLYDFLDDIGYSMTTSVSGDIAYASRDITVPIDVSGTPFYLGHQEAWPTAPGEAGFFLSLNAGTLEAYRDGVLLLSQPLADWAGAQAVDRLTQPWIDLTVEGVRYRFVITNASWKTDSGVASAPREVIGVSGLLFADDGTVAIPRP